MAENQIPQKVAGQGAREHARVVREILAKCGSRHDCRLWANNTGVGRGLTHDGVVRFGLVGSADILGIFRGGTLLAIEVKTGEARRSRQQAKFAAMIRQFGGYYKVTGSAQETWDWLDSLQTGDV